MAQRRDAKDHRHDREMSYEQSKATTLCILHEHVPGAEERDRGCSKRQHLDTSQTSTADSRPASPQSHQPSCQSQPASSQAYPPDTSAGSRSNTTKMPWVSSRKECSSRSEISNQIRSIIDIH